MNNKILILSNSFAGLYSFRKEVIQAYLENEYDVYISCPIGSNKPMAEWFEKIGCKIIDTKFNRQGINPIADIKLIFTYKSLIKRIKPLVVLSYTIKPNLYGGMACASCDTPQFANITGLGAALEYPGILQKLIMMLYRYGLRRTNLTFFQNEENRQFCLNHRMIKGVTQLIPGSGVNLQYHSFKEYPSECEPIRFNFIGRIRREKGIEEYLTAAEQTKKKFSNTEFCVIGNCEGKYEQILAEMDKRCYCLLWLPK